ncbi:unnamed protein product [Dracunculus medinensis]|uniref:Cytochrome P450 n=1 Tax=Dracunculus medinensis TaxID=318479 RepID=A0A0N4U0D9_DRAME|nr:unnamed protein product [Dracunculus medinensis]
MAVMLLMIVLILIFIMYGKKVILRIKQYIRVCTLIDPIPGPKAIPILGNVYNLKWDAEVYFSEFTYQMEYYFRKYAYVNDGILRFWIGPVPIIFLSRPKTVKVCISSMCKIHRTIARYMVIILENSKLLWKPPEYSLLEPIWGTGLITSSGEKWHQRRRMLTPAFHFKMLHNYLKILIEALASPCDEKITFDLLPYLRRFSLDTISETAMGMSINAQKGENENFYLAVTRIFDLLFKNLRYPWLWIKPVWYAMGYGYEFDKHTKVVVNLVSKVVAERTKNFNSLEIPDFEQIAESGKKNLAFLDLLLSLKQDHKLTEHDILEEVGTFLIAGYDTVSSSIGFVLFLLGHRPSIQEKVYRELRDIFGETDREITRDDLKKMKYLEQCMKESIRLYPTVVLIGRRITQDIEIGGYTIPAGVTACISPFAVARDPEQWKNPETFDPEHFSAENIAKRDAFAFIPFSAGPRNCLGQKFAIMEEKIALAYVLRKYRVISMICEEENRALPEVSLKPSKGFPMRFELRNT